MNIRSQMILRNRVKIHIEQKVITQKMYAILFPLVKF